MPVLIALQGADPYLRSSMHRLIAALFVALAMFVSPLAMASAAGLTVAHATVSAQADGHCAGGETSGEDASAPGKANCGASCAACLSIGPVSSNKAPTIALAITMAGPQLLCGIHPERETPPPRFL